MFRLLTAAAAVALTVPALAEQPSYNYIQGGYQRIDVDGGPVADFDGDGFGLGGSFEIGENWHVNAGYSTVDFGFGVDLNQANVGFGFHTGISENTSFFADLSWLRAEADAGGLGSASDDGYGIAIGLRSNLTDNFELAGHLAYADLGDGADGTSVGAAAWYNFNKSFAIGLFADVEEDATGYGVGARVYFGR